VNGFLWFFIGLVVGFVVYYGVLFYIFRKDICLYVRECLKYEW